MGLSDKKQNRFMVILLAGAFLASLGQSLMTSSIPTLAVAFGVTEVTAEWLTTAYILVLGIISALTACLINRFTTRQLFISVMSLFAVGCALSLCAWNFEVLLASRVIQAVGAGVVLPLAQVVLLRIYPREHHGQAFATMGVVLAFAPSIGPTLSGILNDTLGWRSIFAFLLILCVVILAAGIGFIKNVGERFNDRIDILSAILYGVGFCALMLSVSKGVWYAGIIGAALLATFAVLQLKLPAPLLKLRIFGDRTFTLTFILIVIGYLAQMAGVILMPLYLQTARGFSATVSGLVMLPGALSNFISNPLGGRLLDKKGAKITATLGMSFLLAGALMAALFFTKTTPLFIVSAAYLVIVVGVTFASVPLVAYAVGNLKDAELSHGNAIISSMRQMFGTLGASALVAITSAASNSSKTDVHGINVAYDVQTALFLIGLILAVIFIKNKKDLRVGR